MLLRRLVQLESDTVFREEGARCADFGITPKPVITDDDPADARAVHAGDEVAAASEVAMGELRRDGGPEGADRHRTRSRRRRAQAAFSGGTRSAQRD
jgi:hypothetical protein